MPRRAAPGCLWTAMLVGSVASGRLAAQGHEVARLTPIDWVPSLVSLSGPARPGGYLAAVGRRSIAIGSEQGTFEVWAWPIKLLHGFNLKFLTPLFSDPLPAAGLARGVEVTPSGVVITYTHPAFTVRQRVFAPVGEPAVAIVLDVDAVRPLEILAEFQSDLQLAWPGAVGGQYVFWDEGEKALVLSESQRKLNGLVGSPFTTSATNQPSHDVPDAPSQLRIAVGDTGGAPMPRPGEPVGRLTPIHLRGIPIVIVGAQAPRDSVRAIYHRVLAGIPGLYAERVTHTASVLDSALWVESPDPRFDTAVRWAAINMDEAMVCNPDLGCGLVAGYGPSEAHGARPGFGWFFGGDASINSLGMMAAGQFALARDGLEFFARYQRSDGKIPHEISQSAGRIKWFEDYPYAFYHADTTPYWIMAWGDYWKTTGDTGTIRRMWPAILKAYQWARSTIDSTSGLMLNSKGGLGAVEVGDLGTGVQSDIYLSAVWIEALDRVARLADAVGSEKPDGRKRATVPPSRHSAVASEARALRDKALASLRDRFWLQAAGMYAFALLDSGQVRPELTVWPSTALGFGLFDDERGMRAASGQARATLRTDWGSRALAGESRLFDPLHYNNGTVWPFCTGFAALGQYRYRNPVAGFGALSTIVNSSFGPGLGHNPEVMAGMMYEPLETAVPHQFFGTSFILTVLGRGLLGWEPDVPAGVLHLAPQLPAEWDHLKVHNARAGASRYDISFQRLPGALRVAMHRSAASGLVDTLDFAPHLPLGTVITGISVQGGSALPALPERRTARDVQPEIRIVMAEDVQVEVRYNPGFEVILPPVIPARGDRSRGLRLLDQRLSGDTLVLMLEGPAGSTDTLAVRHGEDRRIPVTFPGVGDPVDGYVQSELRVAP